MTKRDIVQRCYKNVPAFSKSLIEKTLNLILREISLSLKKGENVKISGFGTWQKRNIKRKSQKKFSVKFKPSRKLLIHLNTSDIGTKIRR